MEDKPKPTGVNDGTKEFREDMTKDLSTTFDGLREKLTQMDLTTTTSRIELQKRDNVQFWEKQEQLGREKLLIRQKREQEMLKQSFLRFQQAFEARKQAALMQRQVNNTAEKNQITIIRLEKIQGDQKEMKDLCNDYRQAFEQQLREIEKMHTKIRKKLSATQDKRIQDKKTLKELETSTFTDEKRQSVMKAFSFHVSQQKAKDKKIGEQQRTAQTLEIKLMKQRFERELQCFEQLQLLKIKHQERIAEQEDAMLSEHQRIDSEAELQRFKMIEQKHQIEFEFKCRKLERNQSNKLKKRLIHKEQNLQRMQQIHESKITRVIESDFGVIHPPEDMGICSVHMDMHLMDEEEEVMQSNLSVPVVEYNVGQERKMRALERKLELEYLNFVQKFKLQLDELEKEHRNEAEELSKHQKNERELFDQKQEKEARMEEQILNTEQKMLIERKSLNMILHSVVDGIIVIDTKGIIQKLNSASEKIFGYQASELIGKNISTLQPREIGIRHNDILKNYLKTGIRNVIGIGRSVNGVRKDKSLVRIHLSLSEVKTGDAHLFAAVIRNLENEAILEEQKREKQLLMQKQLTETYANLEFEKQRFIQNKELPEHVTILVSEVYQFADLCDVYSVQEGFSFLDKLHDFMDKTALKYNLYLEAQGDLMICVNGDQDHAEKLCKLAKEILQTAFHFCQKKVDFKIGLHSGSIVNSKHKITGDAINVARRIKTTGEPNKIHVSEQTKLICRMPVMDAQNIATKQGEIKTFYII